MAAIENLEIIVDVDIARALANLQELQQELAELGADIEALDVMGREGIDIDVDLHDADRELAMLKAKLEGFEAANDLNIGTDVGDGFDRGRFVIPGVLETSGQRADNVGDLFGFMDFPGGRDRRRGILPNLMRRLGDNIDQAVDAVDDFDLRMSDMHNMMARLIPLLIVFIGVIPAAVTALVGLAAAAIAAAASLAAIGAIGALGVGLQGGQFSMERLTRVWEDIRDSFIEAFAPLAERLQPLFEDGIAALGRFFQLIADQGDALMALTDEARDFGGFLMDFLPGALRTLAGLVEALSPLFADLGRWLDQNFNAIMARLVELTQMSAPSIAEFITKLGQAVPWLVKMSIGFTLVANAVLDFFGLIGTLLDLLGISPTIFGIVVGSLLTLATAFSLANWAAGVFGGTFVATVASALWGGLKAISAATIGFIKLAFAEGVATGVLATFISVATLLIGVGIAAWAASQVSKWLDMASGISQATDAMRDFNRVSGKTDGPGFNPYGGNGPGDDDDFDDGGGSGMTVINIESGENRDDDRSNARYAKWREGRTTK